MTKKPATTTPELKIEYVDIESITPYINNAKQHPPEQVAQIAASIKAFGMSDVIGVDEQNTVIYGHGRLLACQKLKMKTVPIVRLNHLSVAERKAFVIAHNKLTLNSGFSNELLKIELDSLKEMNFDLGLTGFTMDEIKGLELDVPSSGSGGEGGLGDTYTKKINIPIYEPKGPKPAIEELFDLSKAEQLIKEIKASSLPDAEKIFLQFAAYRHVVFNYENIAEYYAHSDKDTQTLIENSALVIIDFDKAIENGFVKLAADIAEGYLNDSK